MMKVFVKILTLQCLVSTKRSHILKHGCFPVNFAKFLRTPFLQNTSGRLLLCLSIRFWNKGKFWDIIGQTCQHNQQKFSDIWGAVMAENCKTYGGSPQTALGGFTALPTALHNFYFTKCSLQTFPVQSLSPYDGSIRS